MTSAAGRHVSKSRWRDRVVMWRRIFDDKSFELATLACTLDKWKDADEIDTLAAAYAETGNFAEAEHYQQKAMALLSEDEALRPRFRARLEQYRSKQPVRQEIS